MQDLEDGVRRGRGTLSAVAGNQATKVRPFVDDSAVVPGHRLLDLASALSEGATAMHARLRHLEPEDREAILDLLAGQMSTMVSLWTDLVREVVGTPLAAASAGAGCGSPGFAATEEEVGPSTDAHPSARRRRPPEPAVDLTEGIRRLPRRETTFRAADSEPERRMAPTPALRPVVSDEAAGEYEGDRLTRDELTGVLNRQAGFAALGRELDRCRRAGERFVLGYLDVDGLKEVNSSAGPRRGDELLRQVTAALRATLRSYDVIMRLEGDEFLFSLPGADRATAELRAQEFGVILAEEAPGATATVGFAELRGNDTLDEIISRAEIELVKNRRTRVHGR